MPVPSRPAPRDDPEDAYAAGLRLLARREHGTQELGRKLEQRGFNSAAIEPALERLREDGYLSDARFAAALARHRAAQGYGDLRIRAELAQHGVEQVLTDAALEELGADWAEQALAQARRHFLKPPETVEARARVQRYLTQRGFAPGATRAALAAWAKSVQKRG